MPGRYFISLDLAGKECLVVGGGQVAERKVRSLLECGARVKVVSPEISSGLKDMFEEGKIAYRRGFYNTSDLEGVFLVIGSTDREEVNRRVASDCSVHGIIVNIVDDPAISSFLVPSILRRGALTIAVSTDGKSPLLARKIREELEEVYGSQYGEFLDMLGDMREEIISSIPNSRDRKDVFENMVDDKILKLVREGRMDMVKERILNAYRSGRS